MAATEDFTLFSQNDSIFPKVLDATVPSNADSLITELSCERLEALYPHLDLFARKSGSHIDPLHVHLRKGRTIRITEDGGLHLLWDANIVFIKPLPSCLLKLDFWNHHLGVDSPCRPHALGFMRTYAYMIRHRSDFTIAQREDLIPPSSNELHYSQFENFIKKFRDISDEKVSKRWHFGQLRLTRLNWAVRVFQPPSSGGMLRRFFYAEQYYQTGQFVREFGPPILFIFATLSLILSAMQVVLAARADDPWKAFVAVSAWFSVFSIVALVFVFLALALVVIVVFALQLGFALRNRKQQPNNQNTA